MEESREVEILDEFYDAIQKIIIQQNEKVNLGYVTSRSTEENVNTIEVVCSNIKNLLKNHQIPIEGNFLRKIDLSIKAYMYFICNTNFTCQSLLANDTAIGHLVDIQPPFSPYLLLEILWHINFEDILAESILHYPLDLCVEILEILPRCLDLLEFQRASKFLATVIPNVYTKLITLRDIGSQTKNITENSRRLVGNFQELILQFSNERFLKLKNISKSDQYKRHGTLLKTIIEMVKVCLASKYKRIEIPCDMKKMYKLTFGWAPYEKLDNAVFEELLREIDRELVNLLLKKVKEIDCHTYLNWTEYDDEENTSLTLQRAIGLKAYFFIENTKEFEDMNMQEYNHLIECLQQIASKPDPENSTENLQLVDLCSGVNEGKTEYLIALFQRYKEWNSSVVDLIDSNISLLKKEECEKILEYFTMELDNPLKNLDLEKLQLYSRLLAKCLLCLKITELYELIIKYSLKFGENDNLEKVIDIANFKKFIIHNPNLTIAKNLRVVLFFLLLKTKSTLKILLKMVIGHFDYPDVAVSLDDLILLLPVMKIQTFSNYDNLMETLKIKCSEKGYDQLSLRKYDSSKEPKNVTLVVRMLQEICLEGREWNSNKFANLLQLLYSFCNISEIVKQIFIPFLMSDLCSSTDYLKYTLAELHKLIGRYDDYETCKDLSFQLNMKGVYLLKSNSICRYVVDELLNMIISLVTHISNKFLHIEHTSCVNNYIRFFLYKPQDRNKIIDYYGNLHVKMLTHFTGYPLPLINDDTLRYFLLKCTKKQYINCVDEIIGHYGSILKWSNKSEICDNIIRLTCENCLLCLEYPEIEPPDSISFQIRCLKDLLYSMKNSYKKNEFSQEICKSLVKHLTIMKPSIECTAISNPYNELLKECQKSHSNLITCLTALSLFDSSCIQESEKLKVFTGTHSPIAIRLWLAHSIISKLMNDTVTKEEYTDLLHEYFKQALL